jgi:hypothetical protein
MRVIPGRRGRTYFLLGRPARAPGPNARSAEENTMSATAQSRPPQFHDRGYEDDSGSIFGGIALLTVGAFQFFEGLSAVLEDEVYVRTPNYLYEFDLTAWGWLHLVIGAVAAVVGVAVLVGQRWALVVGIILASLSALTQFLFLPWQPIWASVIIAIDIAVIWALAVRLRTA